MDDKLISDISYTNLDFNSIYPELLDIAKKLTNKWDPSVSNESDPGVVLLKLAAIIADKNNYHIDKNILECFPSSVTQPGNARKLYDSLGYHMKWYQSATTKLVFTMYKTANVPVIGHTIPKFTMITDDKGQNIFTLMENVALASIGTNTNANVSSGTQEALAIEGVIHKFYTSSNTTTITLSNLDENLRLYFTENMIAENGIFISNVGSDGKPSDDWTSWQRSDNLAAETLGQTKYEFGVLPDSNTCYIQFPSDIATLIGAGLEIQYITTKGKDGNIPAYTLNKFYTDEIANNKADFNSGDIDASATIILNDNIVITQPNAVLDGLNIEDLDTAYENYKKIIGTFNTLVTCKDYESFIYNAEDNRQPLVSNIVVADRTNDINGSCDIKSWDLDNELSILSNPAIYTDGENNAFGLNAYNILFYTLNPISTTYNEETFNNSFDKLSSGTNTTQLIEQKIKAVKSIQHDLVSQDAIDAIDSTEPGSDLSKLYICKNLYKLNGKIFTYYKISKAEKTQIEDNIKNALYKTFNARQVNFGESISYDKIISTIQNADSRIKTVALDLPEYTLNYMTGARESSNIVPIDSEHAQTYNCVLLAKMILSGHYALFTFNDDFNYDFNQESGTINNNPGQEDYPAKTIASITSSFIKTLPAETEYTLKDNEVIEFSKPNLIDVAKYSTNVYYTYPAQAVNTSVAGDPEKTIPDNVDFELPYDLYLNWYDENNVKVSETISAGSIIRSSVKIPYGGYSSSSAIVNGLSGVALNSGEFITKRSINQITLTNGMNCYWILNNAKNELSLTRGQSYILKDNEYFIYTDNFYAGLVILGVGTEIKCDNNTVIDTSLKLISLSDLYDDGASSLSWYPLTGTIYVTELQIKSITTGIKITNASTTDSLSISGQYTELTTPVIISDTSVQLSTLDGINWNIRSKLNIAADNQTPQKLLDGQSITLTLSDGATPTINGNTNNPVYLLFNYPVYLSGGSNIDINILDLDPDNVGLKAYTYRATESMLNRLDNGFYKKELTSSANSLTLNYTFKQNFTYLIPVHIDYKTNKTGDTNIANINLTNCEIFNPYPRDPLDPITTTTTKRNNIIILVSPTGSNITSITLTANPDSGGTLQNMDVYVGKISVIDPRYDTSNNLKPIYNIPDAYTPESVLSKMHVFDTNNDFNWVYRVKDTDKITNPLSSEAFWDPNHIYNKYTIAQLDTKTSRIEVSPSSLK